MGHEKIRWKKSKRLWEKYIDRKSSNRRKNEEGVEICNNEESENLSDEATIIGTLKSVTLSRAGHVWRSEDLIEQIDKIETKHKSDKDGRIEYKIWGY